MEEIKVTSISELKEYSRGQIVRLPDFSEGQPFYARLRRPSILALSKAGKIPNSLMITANKLFNGDGMDSKNEAAMSDVLEIMDIICAASFVEPSFDSMKKAGIQLTDEQYMAVFNYSQNGVRALEPFRQQSKDTISAGNGTEV